MGNPVCIKSRESYLGMMHVALGGRRRVQTSRSKAMQTALIYVQRSQVTAQVKVLCILLLDMYVWLLIAKRLRTSPIAHAGKMLIHDCHTVSTQMLL